MTRSSMPARPSRGAPSRTPWHARWRAPATPVAGRGRRPGAPAGRGLGAARRHRAGPAALDDPLRAAGLGQDDAGPDRGRGGPRRAGGAAARSRPGRAEVRNVLERAQHRRAAGRADGVLPRRDPPLQQGPAGRAAARGRGGPRHAHRRHDGEPLLRGQLGAALALPDLRAAPAAGERHRGRPAPRAPSGSRPRPTTTRSPSWPRAPAAMLARRCAAFDLACPHSRPGDARRGAGRAAAPRADATTRPATATTTRSRPGSRPRAARTPTPACTTWRSCSRAARTRASSCGG